MEYHTKKMIHSNHILHKLQSLDLLSAKEQLTNDITTEYGLELSEIP